jgi:flavin-dependent thymidylate synthase
MKVNLAGYNIESDVIRTRTRGGQAAPTPETIAAAYARISRSRKSVEELRKDARREVAAARKLNRTIVFDMGHHSIAEHAVFNFDIIGISRLAAEALEHHRLNAYTEKSQRYVTLDDDYLVPEELRGTEFEEGFCEMVRTQNRYYHVLKRRLSEHLKARHSGNQPARLEDRAKEDARYVTSLATRTQLGMTVNARSLELMVRRFAASPLAELRELGVELYRQAVAVAPSLLLFTGVTDYDTATSPRLREFATGFMAPAFPRRPRNFIVYSAADVSLVDYTPNADNKLLAALMHSTSSVSYAECLNRVERHTLARKKEIFKLACRDLQAYDAVLREFEHLYVTYELVISATCYAQLKRHRIATMTVQPYNPNVGWTIPESVAEIKEHRNFKDLLARTEEVHGRIAEQHPVAAQYVLTNSHQRRVLMTLDARELYHIARLREDAAAQWDIRDIATRMVEQARNVMPLALMLACGKDEYARVYEKVFGEPPAVTDFELPAVRIIPAPEPAPTSTPRRLEEPELPLGQPARSVKPVPKRRVASPKPAKTVVKKTVKKAARKPAARKTPKA